MPLSREEQAELAALRAEMGPMNAVAGGLSPEERAELDSLRTEFSSPQARSGGPVGLERGVRDPVDYMSSGDKLLAGIVGGIEDIGLGTTQIAEEGILPTFGLPTIARLPGGKQRSAELEREAMDMAQRKKSLYDTTEGTIGQVFPALLTPSRGPGQAAQAAGTGVKAALRGIRGAAGGGVAYGALQPVTGEGQRSQNALESGAAFGAGDTVGRALGAGINRVRAPARGGRAATATDKVRAQKVQDAEALGFKVPVGGRTGGSLAKGMESVFESVPVTSKVQRNFREANIENANQKMAQRWGSDAKVLTKDVLKADKKAVGKEFEQYIQANAPINYDLRFMVGMKKFKQDVESLPKEYRTPALEKIVKTLYDDIAPVAGRGRVSIDGKRYKLMRTKLTDEAGKLYSAGERDASRQVNNVIESLDEMAGRSVPKELQEGYKAARGKWRALRIAEDSVDDAGNVVANKLDRAAKGSKDDFYEKLSSSMKIVSDRSPNSGTATRALSMAALASPALYFTGIPGIGGESTPIDYAQGLAVPFATQAAMLNPYTARYISKTLKRPGATANAFSRAGRTGLGVGGYGLMQSGNQ